ncbi:MAG: DNA cytosine methyltransferase [Thiotrichales bacterium]
MTKRIELPVAAKKSMMYFIDLFCGAGGVTTGIHMARGIDGQTPARVIACVNHDKNAILSHQANHPDALHFTEDIRTLDLTPIAELVAMIREQDPSGTIHLWASLECTNFSKAKGGLPRDADSRTLAEHLFRYVEELQPDRIWIENVREFMAWGPLDEHGKPRSRKNGRDYIRWCNKMQSYGYSFDWRLLCCADYGDYTSRVRYFAQFAKGDIKWPEKTHSRAPKKNGMFPALQPWKPVREVLDLDDHGDSIFDRPSRGKKPLVQNSLKRIYAGLVKFVGKGEEGFITKAYSGNPFDRVISLRGSAPTVTTIPHEHIIKPVFFAAAYGGSTEQRIHGLDRPSPTITTQDRIQAVLIQYNGGQFERNVHSTERPAITLTTRDRLGVVQFLPMQYGQGGNVAGINEPAWAITTNPKHVLASVTRYLVNPQYNNVGASIDKPCFTLIAKMDKRPPSITSVQPGSPWETIELGLREVQGMFCLEDPYQYCTMMKILRFMVAHGIADIKMRMLNIEELKRITGLPTGYVLYGTKGEQKKYIGNAVPTYVVKAMIEAYN